MNLIQLFDMTLKGRAGEEALEWQGRTYTFGELDERSERMAACLAGRGLAKGERLGVYLANCVEYVDLYLACLKLGVICVPVNILYRERELRHIEQDAAPVAIVAAGAVPGLQRCWLLEDLIAEAHHAVAARPAVLVDGDDPATIIYTSGTTGVAKGAVLTHNNWAANAVNLITAWQITAADRLLLALPLFHVHGLGNGLHCWLIMGFRLRLLERFEGAKAAGEFLDFRPTLFFGVPTMYVRLMEMAPELADQIGRSVRLFVCGSAPLPAQLMEEFRARFGSVILERYGMTETLMNISNPYAGERRPGSVGLPLPGVSVKIVDGELYVKGPNVFARYWGREEATQAAFVDGWFRTGDLGSMAEDGYYTLQGRKSDLIISSGFNVYPREIEEFLLELEGVREVAVAARPDPVKGEIAVAFVVGDGDLDVSELEARCRASLASFKVPKRFVKVDALPRNALGKVQKHLLSA
jgi:malonyl-CoA/methylmalonyl-CoA synthetase